MGKCAMQLVFSTGIYVPLQAFFRDCNCHPWRSHPHLVAAGSDISVPVNGPYLCNPTLYEREKMPHTAVSPQSPAMNSCRFI
jgi:hypothetical protein